MDSWKDDPKYSAIFQPKYFDSTWGISPACFNGDHYDLATALDWDTECSGLWHAKWEEIGPYEMINDNDLDWRICTCCCHELISDRQWKEVKRRLERLRSEDNLTA